MTTVRYGSALTRSPGPPAAPVTASAGLAGLGGLPAQGAQAERHEHEPDRHREGDDRGDGGQAAENGCEDTGQPGDKVVRGVHRDAKETRHEETAFQLRRDEGWRRPRNPRAVTGKGRPPGPPMALWAWTGPPRRDRAG